MQYLRAARPSQHSIWRSVSFGQETYMMDAVANACIGFSKPHVFQTDKLRIRNADQSSKPVVLVNCGSFNPPTIMHLRMFELAMFELAQQGYNVLGGYISPVGDAYGKSGLAPAPMRVDMCKRAAASSDLVMVDSWEARQSSYTRTLEVLAKMQEELAKTEALAGIKAHVMLLCGADLVASLSVPGLWEDPAKLLREYGVVCVAREGTALPELLESDPLLQEHAHNIVVVEDHVGNSISSSKVRTELAAGRSVKYLVDDQVINYIHKHGLYSKSSAAACTRSLSPA